MATPVLLVTVPELVMATGGCEPAVRAMMSTGGRVNDFAAECMQCLDAPEIMPAGSTQDTHSRPGGWKPLTHNIVASVIYRGGC